VVKSVERRPLFAGKLGGPGRIRTRDNTVMRAGRYPGLANVAIAVPAVAHDLLLLARNGRRFGPSVRGSYRETIRLVTREEDATKDGRLPLTGEPPQSRGWPDRPKR